MRTGFVRRLWVLLPLLLLAAACEREAQAPEAGQTLSAAKGTFDPIPELAYVGVGYSPYVTVLQIPEMRELARIYLPGTGVGTPGIAPDGKVAYIPHWVEDGPAGVSKVDLSTHAVLETVWLPDDSEPFDIVLTPNGRRAFVTEFEGHNVAVIDTRKMELLAEIEVTGDWVNGIATGPGGHTLFIASQASERVHVIDANTLELVETIATGMATVNELALTPDGDLVFVTAGENNTVVVIDALKLTVENYITVPAGPYSVAVAPDGREAYVTCRDANVVAVIEIETLEVIDEIPVPPNPQRIAVNTSGKLALTSHRGNGEIALIDLEEREVLATLYGEGNRPGNLPFGIAFAVGTQRNTGGGRAGVPAFLYIAGGQGQTGIIGRPTFDPFKVYLYDAFYDPIEGAEISWQVTGGGGTLHPDLQPTDENGLAYAHLRLGDDPGTNTVTAAVDGVEPVTFTVEGQAGTGAFGFIRWSNTTGWTLTYDLGIQGRPAWGDGRIPGLLETDVHYGFATLRQPSSVGAGHWGFRINIYNLTPGAEYSLVLARYGLIVNGLHDALEMLGEGPAVPDELVLLDASPGGYPDNECNFNAWDLPVPADANPFVVGYFVADEGGIGTPRCNLLAAGRWWSDASQYAPPGAEDLAPFIPNSTDPQAGRFTLPSYNYMYVIEGKWSGLGPVPDDKIILRWHVGIDLDLDGNPIEGWYAPLPIWPKYWP